MAVAIYLLNAQVIPAQTTNNYDKPEATRTRKLLLKKSQIMQLIGKVEQKGYTLIATKVYRNRGKIKVEIALAKGKKEHDKREAIKQRDWEMEKAQLFKKGTKS